MGKELLVDDHLTEKMIAAGKRFLQELDRSEFHACAAFWFFQEEQRRWQFVVASPLVWEEGPLKAFEMIDQVLQSLGPEEETIPFENISARDPSDRIVRLVCSLVRSAGGKTGFRADKCGVGGTVLDDVYVYRGECENPD